MLDPDLEFQAVLYPKTKTQNPTTTKPADKQNILNLFGSLIKKRDRERWTERFISLCGRCGAGTECPESLDSAPTESVFKLQILGLQPSLPSLLNQKLPWDPGTVVLTSSSGFLLPHGAGDGGWGSDILGKVLYH